MLLCSSTKLKSARSILRGEASVQAAYQTKINDELEAGSAAIELAFFSKWSPKWDAINNHELGWIRVMCLVIAFRSAQEQQPLLCCKQPGYTQASTDVISWTSKVWYGV